MKQKRKKTFIALLIINLLFCPVVPLSSVWAQAEEVPAEILGDKWIAAYQKTGLPFSNDLEKAVKRAELAVDAASLEEPKELIFGFGQIKLDPSEINWIDQRGEEKSNIDAALDVLQEEGFGELATYIYDQVNIVTVPPINNSPLIALYRKAVYRAIHPSLDRRAIYISKGLYELIKEDSRLLAAALIRGGYPSFKWNEKHMVAVMASLFDGPASEFRIQNINSEWGYHIEAKEMEARVSGKSEIISGSRLEEVTFNYLNDFYRAAGYQDVSDSEAELIDFLFENKKSLIEIYLSEALGFEGITIDRIRDVQKVGSGHLKEVYRVAVNTNLGYQVMGIRLIRDGFEDSDGAQEGERVAREEPEKLKILQKLHSRFSSHLRIFHTLDELSAGLPSEKQQRFQRLMEEKEMTGITFGEFIPGHRLDRIPEERKTIGFQKSIELLMRVWFLSWLEGLEKKPEIEGESRFKIPGITQKGIHAESFLYQEKKDQIFFTGFHSLDSYSLKDFIEKVIDYLDENFTVFTKKGKIPPAIVKEVIVNIFLRGMVNVIGREEALAVLEYLYETEFKEEKLGRKLFISIALRELGNRPELIQEIGRSSSIFVPREGVDASEESAGLFEDVISLLSRFRYGEKRLGRQSVEGDDSEILIPTFQYPVLPNVQERSRAEMYDEKRALEELIQEVLKRFYDVFDFKIGYQQRLPSIMRHLIENAFDHTYIARDKELIAPEDGIVLFSARKVGNKIIFEFEDHGEGVGDLIVGSWKSDGFFEGFTSKKLSYRSPHDRRKIKGQVFGGRGKGLQAAVFDSISDVANLSPIEFVFDTYNGQNRYRISKQKGNHRLKVEDLQVEPDQKRGTNVQIIIDLNDAQVSKEPFEIGSQVYQAA